MHGADVCAEAGGVGVRGHGDEDLDVVGCGAAFELCAGLSRGGLVGDCWDAGGLGDGEWRWVEERGVRWYSIVKGL